MSMITDYIWIGSYDDVCNTQMLNAWRINHVMCCANELPLRAGFPYSKERIGYKVPIVDNMADEKTMDRFLEGAAKLNEWISQGNRVIVHCMAGMSRSVSVVITYLMVYKGWSFRTSHDLVRLRRWQTDIYPGFMRVLEEIKRNPRHNQV